MSKPKKYHVPVPPITREEQSALLKALMAHKKGQPFSESEVLRLEDWARSIRFQVWVLDGVLSGKVSKLYISEGKKHLMFDLADSLKEPAVLEFGSLVP